MACSLNEVLLIGNVGQQPEIHTTASGKKVAHVPLATSRRFQTERGYDERTDRLTLWHRLAQLAEEYIRKGDHVFAEGRIEYGSYEKDDGTFVPTAEIIMYELILLGRPGGKPRRRRPPTSAGVPGARGGRFATKGWLRGGVRP